MWHMKGVPHGHRRPGRRPVPRRTRYDKDKAPEAGRKSDPKTGGGYANNVSDDKKGPKWALKGNKPAPPYWIVDAEKEPFDDSKYKAGDEVPGIVVAPVHRRPRRHRGQERLQGRRAHERVLAEARHRQ